MGDCGAHDPACASRWAQTIGQRARGAERDFLHPMDRVSVEGVAQRPAAKEHGARLSGAVVEHAGRVMSRDALMNTVKGEQFEAFDRSIDVHVSRIRAAIEDDPKKPRRVITVRGTGYVFAKLQD